MSPTEPTRGIDVVVVFLAVHSFFNLSLIIWNNYEKEEKGEQDDHDWNQGEW